MRIIVLSLVAFAFICSSNSSASGSEPNKAPGTWEMVSFWTADSVKFQGYFYPGPKGAKSPTVILIHNIGDDATRRGWRILAADLQTKQHAAILLMSLRGHGPSTEVKEEFWDVPINRLATAGRVNPRMLPEEIHAKDFQRGYERTMMNDLTAARGFLDQRNDARGDFSSRSASFDGSWPSNKMNGPSIKEAVQ